MHSACYGRSALYLQELQRQRKVKLVFPLRPASVAGLSVV